MKEKRTRKGFLMLLMLASTAVLISTATYAWFTANRTVTVSPIQVNIEAQGGIQISTDGSTWRSIIHNEDITGADAIYGAAVNQLPSILEPVSSGLNINASGRMEMFYGLVETNEYGDYILTATQDEESHGTEGRFVAFDLFFRVDEIETLYLTANSTIETPDATDTGIKNAARIAFVNLGNTAIGSDLAAIQDLNEGTTADVYLWEPNFNSHTAPAVSHAWDTYGISITPDHAEPIPYSGVIADIADTDDVEVGDATETDYEAFFADVTPDYATVEDFDTAVEMFELPEGISKIRFYMWVEGQDVDCENQASGGNVTFNVQITIDEP